ncbi:MAG: hypothetical protein KGK14_04840 [Bacteroidota bacterium]|nr:hypothetical protein [Bacteroidota bacterium]
MKWLQLMVVQLCAVSFLFAQDTTLHPSLADTTVGFGKAGQFTLPEVMVRTNFNYEKLLQQIKEDTTFYKAFRNLRVLGYMAYNDIQMKNKAGNTIASLYSKIQQNYVHGCRTMDVLEEKTTGDFYNKKHQYNYLTPELYAALFFTKGTICGENNIVKGHEISTATKSGIDKHKEQLKMLFFNPGKKIAGIPFIGNKLDLYDEKAHKLYNYRLDIQEYHQQLCYVFSITPKEDLTAAQLNDVVVDEMVTWFNTNTLEVQGRRYVLSYKAGLYDFEVSMEVEMTHYKNLLVPAILRYKGNWDVLFKKRERAIFTATLFNFK